MTLPLWGHDTLLRSLDADWTAERWAQLPDTGMRHEVIDGVLYMGAVPSFYHQHISSAINAKLDAQIDDTKCGWVSFYLSVFMTGCQPVVPDLLVVRREDTHYFKKYVYGVPALLVEILSPFTVTHDCETKRAAYARAGVPEYWIVRPAERDVLVHSEPEPATGQYLNIGRVPPDGELVSPTLPFRAAIAAFFAGAPDTTL